MRTRPTGQDSLNLFEAIDFDDVTASLTNRLLKFTLPLQVTSRNAALEPVNDALLLLVEN